MSRDGICAKCEHFSLKNSPQATEGIGSCHGYDGHVAPVEPFVRWDSNPCVLFGRAKDWQKREQWIAMRKRDEEAAAA